MPAVLDDGRLAELRAAWLLSARSSATRRAYAGDLAHWLRFAAAAGLAPRAARRAHVDAYAHALAGEGYASSTIARRLSAVSSFYAYAADEGELAANPAARVKRPRVEQEPPLGLDREELRRLIAAATDDGPRSIALVLLLAQEGLRVSEALGLDVADLDTERAHRTITITRKGGKRERRAVAPSTAHAIDVLLGDRTSGPLLLGRRNSERMAPSVAARLVQRLATRAGIGKPLSPHGLRHTSATLALEAGVPLHVVQDHLGHADPRTTRRYDRARGRLDNAATYRLAAYLAE